MRPAAIDATRTTFFDEQAHHRRAAQLWAGWCSLIALVLAAVSSIVLTPFVLVGSALLARLAYVITPLPPQVWEAFRASAFLLSAAKAAFADYRLSAAEFGALLPGFVALLVPGFILVLLLWRTLRASLLRRGAIGVAVAIGARSPRPDDLEERQLLNIVEEMAIAGGLAPPRVLLLDEGPANAAAIGPWYGDATIVVTRALLTTLDRDDTQAVIGHLLASVANGDLRLGMETLAVAETAGFLFSLLEAPLNRTARRTLWRLLRNAVAPARASAADREAVLARMAAAVDPDTLEETGSFIDAPDRPGIGAFKRFLLNLRIVFYMPLFGVILVPKVLMMLSMMLVIGPAVWIMLRHRRHLADATAVQLTRNPDALASALAILGQKGGMDSLAPWAAHLFIVGHLAGRRRISPDLLAARPPNAPADAPFLLIGAHPPVSARLKRLRAMGASLDSTPPAAPRGSFLDLPDVGLPLKVVAVVIAAALVVPILMMFGYLVSVAVMFGALVIVGGYAAALWIVLHLLP